MSRTSTTAARRTATAALAAALAVAATIGLLGRRHTAEAETRPSTQAGTITWSPCAEDASAECGSLDLPVDWANPGGRRFALAVARRRATDPQARLGALVVAPGGPGGSGVSNVLSELRFSDAITRRFDLVGFDPRGVAGSQALRCGLDLILAAPQPLPDGPAAYTTYAEYSRKLGADCRERSGPIFDHADTSSAVRDVEALRIALGEPKLTMYSLSYGTLLAQEYAERYGERIRAIVLDGVVDHSRDTTGYVVGGAEAVQDAFDQFVDWCTRATTCALHGQDVRGVYADLFARAGRGDLTLPDQPTAKLNPYRLTDGVSRSLDEDTFARLATDLERLRTGTGEVVGFRVLPSSGPSEPAEYPLGVFCQDWRLPLGGYRQYRSLHSRLSSVARDTHFSASAELTSLTCNWWPAPVVDAQHSTHVTAGPPLLLVNSRHDPATGYAQATAVSRQLGDRGVLLTYEGTGHHVYGRERCTTDAIDAYLVDLRLPPPGATCPAAGSRQR